MAKKREYLYRLEIERKLLSWKWRARSTVNGQIVATPHENYTRRIHCIRMVCQLFAGAKNVSPTVTVTIKGKEWGKFDRMQIPVVILKKKGGNYFA